MFQRSITEEDVYRILETGEIIEEYPDDKPYPSRLLSGWIDQRPLHILVADSVEENTTFVITVYEPDEIKWEPGYRRRRTQ